MWEAIIPAAATLVGGMLTNSARSNEASKANDFSERMSSSAHQREVADLKAAGLNPMLSLKNGGASAPMGQQAQVEDVISPAVNSAQNARMVTANLANVQSQTSLNEANARKAAEEAVLTRQLQEKALADTVSSRAAAGLSDATTTKVGAEVANLRRLFDKLGVDISNVSADTKLKLESAVKQMTAQKVDLSQVDLNDAVTAIRRMEASGAKANADFYDSVGSASPALNQILQLIKAIK